MPHYSNKYLLRQDDPEADAAAEDGAAEDAGGPPDAGQAGQAGEAAQPEGAAAGPSNAAPAPAAKGVGCWTEPGISLHHGAACHALRTSRRWHVVAGGQHSSPVA